MDLRTTALAELSLLRAADVLPEGFEGGRLEGKGTPIFDLNGTELFRRFPIQRKTKIVHKTSLGYADVAVHPAMGALLLAFSQGVAWDPKALLEQAKEEAGKCKVTFDDARFVVYSFPKIAVQFLRQGRETGMLELFTWTPVPEARPRYNGEPPSNFERWSFLEELGPERQEERARAFRERQQEWARALTRLDGHRWTTISASNLRALLPGDFELLPLRDTRELHYTKRLTDHGPDFELRGQETNVWCVAASVQMMLDFYRYEYTQVRLAQELGLGTLSNPNGLPYSRDADVVTVLENMSSDALDATMDTTPTFDQFRDEIRANRPLISFIPGHSRTVAGYTRPNFGGFGLPSFRGLLVYDPWPPNAGVVTRWENFDSSVYRVTYTAQVDLA